MNKSLSFHQNSRPGSFVTRPVYALTRVIRHRVHQDSKRRMLPSLQRHKVRAGRGVVDGHQSCCRARSPRVPSARRPACDYESGATSSFASAVMFVHVVSGSAAGVRQVSKRPANPNGLIGSQTDQHRCLLRTVLQPLVESVRYYEATPALGGIFECSLRRETLRARVDHLAADRRVSRPPGNEPPNRIDTRRRSPLSTTIATLWVGAILKLG